MKDDNDVTGYFQNLESPFKKSEAELWNQIEGRLSQKAPRPVIYNIHWSVYAAAASAILILGLFFLYQLSFTTFTTRPGQQTAFDLPDGSHIELNQKSTVRFNSYTWNLKRHVQLQGEAFFTVSKGNSFIVESTSGKTEVLGTTFNVFSGVDEYRVFCESGSVRVTGNNSSSSVILSPGEGIVINEKNPKGQVVNTSYHEFVSWRKTVFVFSARPLPEVINELKAFYGIGIELDFKNSDSLIYTGNFSKELPLSTVLGLIGKSFNLNVRQTDNETFVLSE